MKININIEGEAKEIAALALELQGRQSEKKILLDGSVIAEAIRGKPTQISLAQAREIARRVQKYDKRMAVSQSSKLSGSSESFSCDQ